MVSFLLSALSIGCKKLHDICYGKTQGPQQDRGLALLRKRHYGSALLPIHLEREIDMKSNHIYGPVPSRRLGFSLGVDLVPAKICSYDCIYCQIGPTRQTITARKPYISCKTIIDELFLFLSAHPAPDYITLGGSGEPTLNSDIGRIIEKIKAEINVPVAVLTNGSLLSASSVREDLRQADVVLPSFDACDPEMFARINRPDPDIGFAQMAEGLIAFRQMYPGLIWLEIFFVPGINVEDVHAKAFKRWIDQIRPDKVHLNTAIRPTAEKDVAAAAFADLERIRDQLGPVAEIIVPFGKDGSQRLNTDIQKDLMAILSRRPCTLPDLSAVLGIHRLELIKHLEALTREKRVKTATQSDKTYYHAV
jgi:wyosine [tRNA(Phe)-imidazoG37] synthetase (radical SAM superfamily)